MISLVGGCSDAPAEIGRTGSRYPSSIEHRAQRYMMGLDETVIIDKDPQGVRVTRANGEVTSLAALRLRERAAYQIRYGAAHSSFARALWSMPDDEIVPVVIRFEEPTELAEAQRRFRREPSARADARFRIRAALQSHYGRWEQVLHEAGILGPYSWSRAMAVVGVEAPAHAIRAVSRADGVVSVIPAYEGEPIELQSHDPVEFAEIDTSFNAVPTFGAGQRIGILEAGQHDSLVGACGLYDDHEAFTYAQILYQDTAMAACDDFLDCNGYCDYCNYSDQVGGFICTANHATAVASIVSASSSTTPRSAGEAEIYYPNAQSSCGSMNQISAYDWLVLDNEVFTTNESFNCDSWAYTVHGVIQDWYADTYGVTVVRASGNTQTGEEVGTNCDHLHNGICVGSNNGDFQTSCFTRFENPILSDREEPDVSAFGGDDVVCSSVSHTARVAGSNSAAEWVGNRGTSFASPTIAAMVVLMRDQCGVRWPFVDEILVRAIVRNNAYGANVDGGLRYSTPVSGIDYADGGGWLSAAALLHFCGTVPVEGGPATDGGIIDVDLGSGESLPDGEVAYEPGTPREEGTDGWDPVSYDDPGVGRAGLLMGDVDLEVGQRIRYSISWDSHFDSRDGVRLPTEDFDLFLYNATTGQWIYGSQSVDDVNEGFDVVIQEADGAGRYQVWVGWPQGSSGSEQLAWASAVWI